VRTAVPKRVDRHAVRSSGTKNESVTDTHLAASARARTSPSARGECCRRRRHEQHPEWRSATCAAVQRPNRGSPPSPRPSSPPCRADRKLILVPSSVPNASTNLASVGAPAHAPDKETASCVHGRQARLERDEAQPILRPRLATTKSSAVLITRCLSPAVDGLALAAEGEYEDEVEWCVRYSGERIARTGGMCAL